MDLLNLKFATGKCMMENKDGIGNMPLLLLQAPNIVLETKHWKLLRRIPAAVFLPKGVLKTSSGFTREKSC